MVGKRGPLKRNKFADISGRTLKTSYLLNTADHIILRCAVLYGFYKMESVSIGPALQDPPDHKGNRKTIS